MAGKNRRKLNWSSLSHLEQLTLVSTILIWIGVMVFGAGLYLAFRSQKMTQVAYAQATAIASESTQTATPSSTPPIYPAGWATATPSVTPVPPTETPIQPTAAPTSVVSTTSMPSATSKSLVVMPTATPSATPEPPTVTPTPTVYPPPASKPPDRIVIPRIDLDSPIVPIGWHIVEQGGERYMVWQVADYVVSWHKTSAYPGNPGNVVLNGHHNIRGEIFRRLVELEVGDRVVLFVGDQEYHYAVVERLILKEKGEPAEVRRQNAQWIAPTEDERLTMVTCWPYTSNTHRLIVVAKPVPPPLIEGLKQ